MKYLLFFCFFLLSSANYALNLKADAPSRYVVKHGDNLWTIANHYLTQPWEWQTLWRANANRHNPKHLYAGDTLVLDYFQNEPYIKVLPNGTVKLSPNIRSNSLGNAIPAIALNEIMPFLNESLILDEDVLSKAPYVVAFVGEHLMGSQGDGVYVKGLHPAKDLPQGGTIAYSIFRADTDYIDPISKQFLGYKATFVGQGELIAGGEPATVLLTSIKSGIKTEDRVLINNSPELDLYFHPKAPAVTVKGRIIDMPTSISGGETQQALGGVVVINRGVANGLKPGDVLGLYGKTRRINDPKNHSMSIKLPRERLGEIMVFRTFTKTSYALIVRSTKAIYLSDVVSNP